MMRSLVEWIGDVLLESRIVEQALMKLKSESKSSITNEVKDAYFSDHDEARDYVYKTIIDKLDIECDDDIRYEVVSEVTDEFLNNIYNIFDMIASDDFIGMRKYIESL